MRKILDALRDVVHDRGHGIQELARPFYPVLKPPAWARRASDSGVVLRQLTESGGLPADAPLVAYAVDAEEAVAFLCREDLPALLDDDDLHRLALRHLEAELATHASWEELEVDLDGGGRLSALVLGGCYYAAEALLSATCLAEAHERLRAEELALAAPVRGRLFAADAAWDEATLEAFVLMVARQHYQADAAPISPHVFAAREGRLVGFLDGLDDVHRAVEERVLEARAREAASVTVMGLRLPGQGGDALGYRLTSEDPELLLRTAEDVVRSEGQDRHLCSELSGELRLLVVRTAGVEAAGPELAARLDELVEFLGKQLATLGLGPREGESFRLSWAFEAPQA